MTTPNSTTPAQPTPEPVAGVVTKLIVDALVDGLHHPGDPSKGIPASMIHLPEFRTVGMPPPLAKSIRDTTQHVAEAITALILKHCDITPKTP